MSRYQIGNYSYGYDNPLREYFLQKKTGSRIKEIVGCLAERAGTASNFVESVKELGIPVPEEHLQKAMCDLPF